MSACMFATIQEEAFDKTQKYKEGKFILERAKLTDASEVHAAETGGSDCE